MLIRKDFEKLLIKEDEEIINALKKLNETAKKVLFVTDNLKLIGTITDGDIRRHLLKSTKLEGTVKEIYNKNPVFIYSDQIQKIDISSLFNKIRIEIIPVVERSKRIKGYVEWADYISRPEIEIFDRIEDNVPVVVMAGGRGTRMKPFTDVLPKPLIPVGEKTAIEKIIDNFKKFGLNKFYAILNFKGPIIEAYFSTIEKDYEIEFIWENEFLGTAGGIKLLENKIDSENFFVSNCDIFVKANLKEVLQFHRENNSYLTSITSILHYKIPYGVVEINRGGKIFKITEKPEITFQINTGVYLLSKAVLEYIPYREYIDMPNLISILIERGKNVFAYPVGESDYIDIGQWDEYRRAMKILESFGS